MKKSVFLSCMLGAFVIISCSKDDDIIDEDPGSQTINTVSVFGESTVFQAGEEMGALISRGVLFVAAGNTHFFIGYRQVSDHNQDPIMAKYVDGQLAWVRTEFETTGDDSRGYGLVWDGSENLYAVFSVTGTQGPMDADFRRFTTNGWIANYGQGGGAKAAVILRINQKHGEPESGTFLMGKTNDGKTNSFEVKNISLLNSGNVLIAADSWFSPLQTNQTTFTCEGNSPFDYTLEMRKDLSSAEHASAVGCN